MTKYILVVDDDEDVLELLSLYFKSENYNVTTALNGQEALTKLLSSEHQPNIILLDIMMPVMDGFEFLKIKAEHQEINDLPVVVLSGGRFNKDQQELIKTHSKEFVEKPFELEKLKKTVEEYST